MLVNGLIVVLLFGLSGLFYSGRGSWLIAGYNTSSKVEKAGIHLVRLYKVMGTCMLLLGCQFLLCASYQFQLPAFLEWIVPYGILSTIAGTILLANTYCRKTKGV